MHRNDKEETVATKEAWQMKLMENVEMAKLMRRMRNQEEEKFRNHRWGEGKLI